MSPGFYLRYSTRALRRGGQRTMLATFCVAVGVMAIVAVQLAGSMIQQTLTGDARAANGGDVQIDSGRPFTRSDTAYLAGLQQQGLFTKYTVAAAMGGVGRVGQTGAPKPVLVQVVDPAVYPLAGTPVIVQPGSASFGGILATPGRSVVAANMAQTLGVSVGDQLQLATSLGPIATTVGGILRDDGFLDALSVFVSEKTATASARQPIQYSRAFALTPSQGQTAAARALSQRFPGASVTTAAQALQQNRQAAEGIRQLLESAGLLALLVGGIGIVNTMQVMLGRRRLEIAILKTEGYRAGHLYVLFGLEAAILGAAGGLLGALAAVGVSYLVKTLLENVVLVAIYYTVDVPTVVGGIVIGIVTSLIFALLPIAQAAAVRPLAILRDLRETRVWRARLVSAGLLALVALLFAGFATAILGDLKVAVGLTSGTVIVLGGLNLGFRLLLRLLGVYQLPERFTPKFTLLMLAALAVAAGVAVVVPPVGAIALGFVTAGLVAVVLPRRWKATLKLALRGVVRDAGRTAATLVALFVGVFSVSLVLIMASDTESKLQAFMAQAAVYNVVVADSVPRAPLIEQALPGLPGLKAFASHDALDVQPLSIAGEPTQRFIERARAESSGFDLYQLSAVSLLEGTDVTNVNPTGKLAKDAAGRPVGRLLSFSDVTAENVVAPAALLSAPWNLTVGSKLVVADPIQKRPYSVTVIGFYESYGTGAFQYRGLVATAGFIDAIGGAATQREFDLRIDPAQKDRAVAGLTRADPQAFILDIASFEAIIFKFLGNFVDFLLALASMALLAGAVIIANAVALSMLERRREIGILKSVGFASPGILAQVLVENAIVGAVGGASAIAIVGIFTYGLGRFVLKTDLGMNAGLALAVIVVTAGGAAAMAGLVALGPSRIRPLEVLRYE